MAKVKKVDTALKNVKREFSKVKSSINKKADDLAKGVWIALSNANVKSEAKPPSRGGEFHGNRNYYPSTQPLTAFVPLAQGGYDDSETVKDFVKKLKKERTTLTKKQIRDAGSRLATQMRRRSAKAEAFAKQVKRTEKRMELQFKRDARTVAQAKPGTVKWKNAKERMNSASSRLKKSLDKARRRIIALDQHHAAINSKIAKRQKPPKRFQFHAYQVNELGHIKGTAMPDFNEVFRVAGYPKPKSRNVRGSYYMRRRWTNRPIAPGKSMVRIGPENLQYGDDRFLKMLEEGGSAMGGPRYEGYNVHFKTVGRFVHVTFTKRFYKGRKGITVKPRHFVKTVLDKVKQRLNNNKNLQWSDWRAIGRG